MTCLPTQFVKDGTTCEDCPNPGEIPTLDRLNCVVCQHDNVNDVGMCKMCTLPGAVPNSDQTSCMQCPINQIARDQCED